MEAGHTLVVDIGKTLSKVTLWSRNGRLLEREVRPNALSIRDGIRRLDADGIARWLIETLRRHRGQPIETILPVAHGAGVAALRDGTLAFPPLDYEQPIPDEIMAAYRRERDPFALTGSPALPGGLNMGSQLYWLEHLYPEEMRLAVLLPWAQYWAWFLSGEVVSEVTSLGCHSDLWSPDPGVFSPLAQRLGWADRFAPIAQAGDRIGTLRPDIARATGLSEEVRIAAGLHDSNAALLAARGHDAIAGEEATILSTGTWFIAMRLPGAQGARPPLPEARDCLMNVDVHGGPVPSARFMGGREIEAIVETDSRRVDIPADQPELLAAVPRLVRDGAMLLPTLAPGCGPYPAGTGGWINEPRDWPARRAGACLYAALVADTALGLIGSQERLLVEGRFAEADIFVRALAALRPDMRVYIASAHNDVSFGALRLIDSSLKPRAALRPVEPLDSDLHTYRARWLAEIRARQREARA